MTSDLDIYRSANLLMKQHGEDAPIAEWLCHPKAVVCHGEKPGRQIMSDLQIRDTTVTERSDTEATVEIWIADDKDPAKATEEISISMKVEYGSNPSLAEVQAKALLRAQAVIAEQIQAKTELANRPA